MKKLEISKTIKKNFKVPIFLIATLVLIWAIKKLFDVFNQFKISNELNYSIIFFAVTFILFFFIVLRNIRDILSLVFGQKGQNSLTDVAKK